MIEVETIHRARVPVGTVYAIGRNYAAHARELGNAVPEDPVVFLKARTAVRGLGPAPLAFDESFHHEVELVLLVGQAVPLGAKAGWADVSAVALGLDLTRREVQNRCKEKGLPWVPAKSFAGSAVVGPFVPLSEIGDPERISFSLEVDGALRQEGALDHMLFPVPVLLSHLASLAPLEAGDLVFTGTPEGVGPIRRGDPFRMTLSTPGGSRSFEGRL
jgi:2-keto-4-pentenoate hydratase/2-oxohepta-3-ene-1,7-dioic acid hydratase in catechol pathway